MESVKERSQNEVRKSRYLLRGGRVISPSAGRDGVFDLLVGDGKVLALEQPGSLGNPEGAQTIDLAGKWVVPGLIDLHVHLREPGQEWKETIETGSRAALAGGFTDVCCMPNTIPAIDTAEVVRFIKQKAEQADFARVLPIGAITVGRKGEALSPFGELVEAGAVAFSDDGFPVMNSLIMRRALEYAKTFSVPLAVHEEDSCLCQGFAMNESSLSLRMGLKGMPGAAEDVMIARDIELARLTQGHVHFCHISTARSVTLIKRAKEDGIKVTCEVTPHHLVLDESAVEGYNTRAKMSMPLRSPADVQALRDGLRTGVIDAIASDHAPHESDSKEIEFDKASFGIIGLQTTLPLMLGLVREGQLSLECVIDALTNLPRRAFYLAPNCLNRGDSADITIIDPEYEYVFSAEQVLSKSKNSPFLNRPMKGRAEMVFIEGRLLYTASRDN